MMMMTTTTTTILKARSRLLSEQINANKDCEVTSLELTMESGEYCIIGGAAGAHIPMRFGLQLSACTMKSREYCNASRRRNWSGLYGHVKRMHVDRLPHKLLNWKPNIARFPGRLWKPWIENVDMAVENIGSTLNAVERDNLYTDRSEGDGGTSRTSFWRNTTSWGATKGVWWWILLMIMMRDDEPNYWTTVECNEILSIRIFRYFRFIIFLYF